MKTKRKSRSRVKQADVNQEQYEKVQMMLGKLCTQSALKLKIICCVYLTFRRYSDEGAHITRFFLAASQPTDQ